jgi:PEP-CTERM motif
MQAKRTLASITLLVSCVLLEPAFARADTITTLDVSGEYRSPSYGTFSGTLTVDVTSGTATAVDITFPNMATFNVITGSGVFDEPFVWTIFATNNVYPKQFSLDLEFYTSPTATSLVGLTEGSISGNYAAAPLSYLQGLDGSITPAISARPPVPEPSSLALLAVGLVAWLSFAFARVFANRKPIS